MEPAEIELEVRVNGETMGRIRLPLPTSTNAMQLAALCLPTVQQRIDETTVKGFQLLEGNVVDILT